MQRGLESEDSPFIKGHQIYYNFVKPHLELAGKTPSEVAGISIQGDNKWLTLIENAVRYKKAKSTLI